MSNTLQVISPFFIMEVGDKFELSEDGKTYSSKYNEKFNKIDEAEDVYSAYDSEFKISVDYAKILIKEGYLEEVSNDNKTPFVNIFQEIDKLIDQYTKDLSSVPEDMANAPECLKLEKTTVLNNLLKLLNHLKGLKK